MAEEALLGRLQGNTWGNISPRFVLLAKAAKRFLRANSKRNDFMLVDSTTIQIDCLPPWIGAKHRRRQKRQPSGHFAVGTSKSFSTRAFVIIDMAREGRRQTRPGNCAAGIKDGEIVIFDKGLTWIFDHPLESGGSAGCGFWVTRAKENLPIEVVENLPGRDGGAKDSISDELIGFEEWGGAPQKGPTRRFLPADRGVGSRWTAKGNAR